MNIAIDLIAAVLIIFGTIGSVLPFLPGLPLAWLGLLVYAWYWDFARIGALGLLVFAILIILSLVVDVAAPAIAARGHRASRYGLVGASLGGILGVIFLGPIGVLFGPFVGSFVGEVMHAKTTKQALRVAWASLGGLIISSGFKLIIGFSMLVYFVIKLF
ncbi:MAG TPA: DUF456 domain-containing protein [Patescibacteria group bacterium]|nr:DUF456 domain-containing protein [Patescibacteria group bacterium]